MTRLGAPAMPLPSTAIGPAGAKVPRTRWAAAARRRTISRADAHSPNDARHSRLTTGAFLLADNGQTMIVLCPPPHRCVP